MQSTIHNFSEAELNKIIEDKELSKQALSENSPAALLNAVGGKLEKEKLAEIITELSEFARARIMMIVEQDDEKAVKMFTTVLNESKDIEIQAKCLVNLAVMNDESMDEYFLKAIEKGYKRAYGYWAKKLQSMGKITEAIKKAEEGLAKGDEFSFAVLLEIARSKHSKVSDIIERAKLAGINTKSAELELAKAQYKAHRSLSQGFKNGTVRVSFCRGW